MKYSFVVSNAKVGLKEITVTAISMAEAQEKFKAKYYNTKTCSFPFQIHRVYEIMETPKYVAVCRSARGRMYIKGVGRPDIVMKLRNQFGTIPQDLIEFVAMSNIGDVNYFTVNDISIDLYCVLHYKDLKTNK